MKTITQNQRIVFIAASIIIILLIPLIAMQFTSEVNWEFFDFLVAAFLLTMTGVALELVMRRVKRFEPRIGLCVAVLVALLLIWAELGVGIFGTPFAGD